MQTTLALIMIALGLLGLYWSYLHGAERHPGRVANHRIGEPNKEGKYNLEWAMTHPEVVHTRSGLRYAVQRASIKYAEKGPMSFA